MQGADNGQALWWSAGTFPNLDDPNFTFVVTNSTLACLADSALEQRALALGLRQGVVQEFGGSGSETPVAAWLVPLLILLGTRSAFNVLGT